MGLVGAMSLKVCLPRSLKRHPISPTILLAIKNHGHANRRG